MNTNPETVKTALVKSILDQCLTNKDANLHVTNNKWEKEYRVRFETDLFETNIFNNYTLVNIDLTEYFIELNVYNERDENIFNHVLNNINENTSYYRTQLLNLIKPTSITLTFQTYDQLMANDLIDHCINHGLSIKVDSWDTQHYITFIANNISWKPFTKINKVFIHLYTSDIRVNAYDKDEYVVFTSEINKELYNEYKNKLLSIRNQSNIQFIDFINLSNKTKDSILTLISLLITRPKDWISEDNGYYFTFKEGTEVSIYRDSLSERSTPNHQLFIKMKNITIKVDDQDMKYLKDPEYHDLLKNLYDEIINMREEYIPNEKIFTTIVDLIPEVS